VKNLTVEDIVRESKGRLILGNKKNVCRTFSKDTRQIKKGDIYIGIKGEKFDGNKFWREALEKGAAGVIIEKNNYTDDDMKTNPDEALRFAKETGIDALAISFGSSHGNYPEGYVPEFDFERLKEIKEKTKMPLVLHGGSGSGDENIKRCVEFGINKINVGCDFMNANVDSIKKHLKKDPDINYWVMMHQVEIDSQELVKKYIHLSGSEGKSL
jgi:fructose/tagatose bisphosphate aldolase